MKYRPFAEARKYIHKLGLKNQTEWRAYCKSGKKPHDIPTIPHTAYRKEWKGYGDWLGTLWPSGIVDIRMMMSVGET
jgi:hypothetical protein